MDHRTKRQKLQAMADQTVSPEEAEIAKRKLAEMPEDEPNLDYAKGYAKGFYGASGYYTASYTFSNVKWTMNFDHVNRTYEDILRWYQENKDYTYKPKSDPKNPGEDVYNEYVWTYNFVKEEWERH